MLANCGLVSVLPLIWEKTMVSSPAIKLFIGEIMYPTELSWGSTLLLLVSTMFCLLSCVNGCCLYPNLVDSGEKARGIVPPPVLSALAARGTVGIEVKFLCQLGACGSFLPPPPPPKKSHLARWQWIATSCLPGQQEMA